MHFGYARVSTEDQNLALQLDALKAAGCDKIFKEKLSGAKTDRPELNKLIEQVRPGDIVTVWKLDRLGRSIRHLIDEVNGLKEKGVGFRSLKESIDTTTATGQLIFHIFAALAQFERDMLRERTCAGLDAARRRGIRGGRKKGLDPKIIAKGPTAKILYEAGTMTVDEIARQLDISKPSLYKLLRHIGAVRSTPE